MLNIPNAPILITFVFAAVIPVIFLFILGKFVERKEKK